jgi:hypothetical protein
MGSARLVSRDGKRYGGFDIEGDNPRGNGGLHRYLYGDGGKIEFAKALNQGYDKCPASGKSAKALGPSRSGNNAQLVSAHYLHINKQLNDDCNAD